MTILPSGETSTICDILDYLYTALFHFYYLTNNFKEEFEYKKMFLVVTIANKTSTRTHNLKLTLLKMGKNK